MLNSVFYAIGVMSGTSLDGVDLVYVRFDTEDHYSFQIIHAETIAYDEIWKHKLKNAYYASTDLNDLNVSYGGFLGDLINDFIKNQKISKIDFVASHGHTIFHKPEKGYTLQIGDGKQISNTTNLKVIYDFRTQDVALGGQGAPLVPIGDRLLFKEYDFCLNLGGFANISYEDGGKRMAFDICPVNIVLNQYVGTLGFNYDDKGHIASQGTINHELLEELNQLDFYRKNPPKSLGLEWVDSEIFPLIDSYDLEARDILRTFIEHVAIQITSQFKRKKASVLMTGGGVFNEFLISRIKKLTNTSIVIPEKEIIEYKEALIFAFLGLLKDQNKVNVLRSVTGAKEDHSSGQIFKPKY